MILAEHIHASPQGTSSKPASASAFGLSSSASASSSSVVVPSDQSSLKRDDFEHALELAFQGIETKYWQHGTRKGKGKGLCDQILRMLLEPSLEAEAGPASSSTRCTAFGCRSLFRSMAAADNGGLDEWVRRMSGVERASFREVAKARQLVGTSVAEERQGSSAHVIQGSLTTFGLTIEEYVENYNILSYGPGAAPSHQKGEPRDWAPCLPSLSPRRRNAPS